ncbi:MAG: nitroreductase family protein [Planctomycetota bacterium]
MNAKEFENLVIRNRSYRRFDETKRIARETLVELVDLARRTPSAGNRQPLKYAVIHSPTACFRLFPHLRWAAALKDWGGPADGERPTAYVLVFCDTHILKEPGCDHGIAAQTLLLGAAARGLGGCMLGAVDRARIRTEFNVPEHLEIALVIALGVPAEKCVLEDTAAGEDVTYYRDEHSVHHVPKRPMAEVLVELA